MYKIRISNEKWKLKLEKEILPKGSNEEKCTDQLSLSYSWEMVRLDHSYIFKVIDTLLNKKYIKTLNKTFDKFIGKI